MVSRRPSTEWGLSLIEERWFIVCWVAVLSDEMPQFKLDNMYKDDSLGLDVVDDWNETDPKQYKILEKHSLILTGIIVSAFKSTIVLFCAFFLWLAFF